MDQIEVGKVINLNITGMHCAGCVSRVEKALGQVPGVQAVAINLATEAANLQVSEAVALPTIVAAVKAAGYQATLPEVTATHSDWPEIWALIGSFLLSAPLVLAMFFMVPGWVQLGLAAVIQFGLGAMFYTGAWRSLRAGAANMDVLVALGTSAAFGLSLFDLIHGWPLYFESSAAIITLVRLGKFLEGRVKREAGRAVSELGRLRPAIAHVVERGDVPVAFVRIGEVIELRPGERAPADGVIISGQAQIDEQLLTGEALPVQRGPQAKIMAGALNLDGVLRVTVSSAPGMSFLDRMAQMMTSAAASKPKIQRIVDQVAAVFVPVVVGLAILTFVGWMLAGAAPAPALINAVCVLVIACPCALGLATPAAIFAGTRAAARHGVLIRDADAIAAGAKVNLVVFDKTGTLTEGTPQLSGVEVRGVKSEHEVRAIAAALAESDTHPLAKALRLPATRPAEEFTLVSGQGVSGLVDGIRYRLGNSSFAGAQDLTAATQTSSYLAEEAGQVLAAFSFNDEIRADSAAGVARLKAIGCDVMLLSGDNAASARRVGDALGISNVKAESHPEEKLAIIQAARAAGKIVAMVGDGVNDAAALAAADLGIAMGSGADVAIEAAGISLLRPSPALVPQALLLARKTTQVMYLGLFWALVYNVIGLPAAGLGLLTPTIASGAMAASSICVLLNALRLRHWWADR